MAQPVDITSQDQFRQVLASSTVVVVDCWADWCGPCKVISPLYNQLAAQLSRPNKITFTKVNTDQQKGIAQSNNITGLPTFLVFKNGREVSRVVGADAKKLNEVVRKLAAEAESGDSSADGFGESSGSASKMWRGAELPKIWSDVTDEVETKNLDLLNSDSELGDARTLFAPAKPASLDGKAKAAESRADWVESDTDEQLMLYIPFQSSLKVHSIHLTSLIPEVSEDETPMRPKTIHLYANRPHVLGFDEAGDTQATQTITLSEKDWDPKTGTAKVELRFVKFQNITSLVMFIEEGDGDSERVRIDRLRLIGESGQKRAMGKLEKIGDEQGE